MTSKRGQKDVIFDQTGVQNGIKIGLGGTPAEGSRTKSKKRRPGAGNRRPQGRHLDPKIDMFAHFDVIVKLRHWPEQHSVLETIWSFQSLD